MVQHNKRKIDRRIQRTRNLLRDALMRLILQTGEDGAKRYDEITIQDIADEANVARTTFYLHFKDKDELLFETMRDIYEDLYDSSAHVMLEEFLQLSRENCHQEDYQHVAEHPDFYRIMLSERGSAAFLARVRQFLAESVYEDMFSKLTPHIEAPHVPIEIVAQMMAGAQIAAIKWWLDHDMPYSVEDMAFMTESLMKRGLFWALKLEATPMTEEPASES